MCAEPDGKLGLASGTAPDDSIGLGEARWVLPRVGDTTVLKEAADSSRVITLGEAATLTEPGTRWRGAAGHLREPWPVAGNGELIIRVLAGASRNEPVPALGKLFVIEREGAGMGEPTGVGEDVGLGEGARVVCTGAGGIGTLGERDGPGELACLWDWAGVRSSSTIGLGIGRVVDAG